MNESRQIKQRHIAEMNALEHEAAGAMASARDIFQQRLDAITNTRIGNQQQKGLAQLDALREFQQSARDIQARKEQFEQNLLASAQQAALNVKQNIDIFRSEAGKEINLAEYTQPQFTEPSQIETPEGLLQGQIKKRPEDELGIG